MRSGFTLVELLAALILFAGLSVAMLGVIGQSVTTISGGDAAQQLKIDGVVGILRHDLEHAIEIEQVDESTMELTVQSSIDPAEGNVVFEPAIVRYFFTVSGVGDQRVSLWRSQMIRDRDDAPSTNWVSDDLVGLGIGEIAIGQLPAPEPDDSDPSLLEDESRFRAQTLTLAGHDGTFRSMEVWR